MLGGMQDEWIRRILANNEEMPPEAREMMERFATGSAMRVAGALINIVVSVVFGMLGGLLGVAIFKKNAPPPPPATVIPHDPGIAQ